MSPIVYIDMLFLLNLLMDTITIYASSLILKRSISFVRLLLAASLLSVYSCAMFFPFVKIFYSLIGKISILALATIIAFPSRNCEQISKNIITFFSVSAIFGGIMFVIIFASDFGTSIGAAVSNGEIYLNIKASTLLLALIISYICIYSISYIKSRALSQSPHLAEMEITLFSKTVKLKAFADTGCSLCEPLSNNPAIIISPHIAKNLLPPDILNVLNNSLPVNELGEFIVRYRSLPFCTIDSKSGVLHGFVPDKVLINKTQCFNCVIAIANKPISPDSQFEAIFNPSILNDLELSESEVLSIC